VARPRRGLNRGNVASRRLTAWSVGVGGSAPTAFSASGSAILGSGTVPNVEGLTLIRTRGFCELVLRTASAAGEGYTGAIGICNVTDEAFAIGITAIPIPITNMGDDIWYYHRFFSVHAGSGAVDVNARYEQHFEVDSKAMRKTPVGITTVAVIQVVEQGTAILDVSFDTRQLVKLP